MIEELKSRLLDYLALKVENFKKGQVNKVITCTCPVCGDEACVYMPFEHTIRCSKCNKNYGSIIEVVRLVEPDKNLLEDDEIIEYLAELFTLKITTNSKVAKTLEYYAQNGFDCVQIQRDGKVPIEKEWTIRVHKDVAEWREWLETPTNIGVKTGYCSGVTVIDIDHKQVPAKVTELIGDYKGLCQITPKGYHYFYKYVPELAKRSFEFEGVHIDIENDKGQVVVFPSIVEGNYREFACMEEIPEMPAQFKQFLLDNVGHKKPIEDTDIPELQDIPENIQFVNQGNRNNFLVHFGGILRKDLNSESTKKVLELVNNKFLNPPLPQRELHTVIGSLDKYIRFDEKDLAIKILNYLKITGEATARDIIEITKEIKEKVDKTLAYLIKEGYVIKHKRMFHIVKKANWKDTFETSECRINFKLPYFSDIAFFNYGDMLLLGSKTKWGKTTISMNIVKELVKQGIKPYYISLETGSRFLRTAKALSLNEGDFFWAFEADPTSIELEPNSVTILDWLMIEDKSMTDSILKHFVEQLYKTNGILIIFMQLKEDEAGSWFAPNMVKQFPALAARYFYSGDDGTDGYWYVDVIREPQLHAKTSKIACRYDFKTRRHLRIEDWEKEFGQQQPQGVL